MKDEGGRKRAGRRGWAILPCFTHILPFSPLSLYILLHPHPLPPACISSSSSSSLLLPPCIKDHPSPSPLVLRPLIAHLLLLLPPFLVVYTLCPSFAFFFLFFLCVCVCVVFPHFFSKFVFLCACLLASVFLERCRGFKRTKSNVSGHLRRHLASRHCTPLVHNCCLILNFMNCTMTPPTKVHLNADDTSSSYPLYANSLPPPKRPGTVRIWVDGCFDMLHFGHANALRQAASLGDELFVGCHSDEEIIRYKGPPIMRAHERFEALRACKWVDFVVEGYPYVTRLADMDRFEIDYVVHGDDISLDLNNKNTYQEIIDAGRFKVVKRTESISTTDLVGRMLICNPNKILSNSCMDLLDLERANQAPCHYLTTSRKIAQFSNNRSPAPGDRVVYVDGSFDLFHYGHTRVLQKARELGDYLIAGIHEDSVIRKAKGNHFPIMSLNERVLGVLSCRYVDEVVLGAPYEVTRGMIESLGINVVVSGKMCDAYECGDGHDAYAVPKAMGCFCEVDSGCSLTTYTLIERVMENHVAFLKRQSKKRAKDQEIADNKPEVYKNVREV